MKRKILLIIGICIIALVGCGKEKPVESSAVEVEQVEEIETEPVENEIDKSEEENTVPENEENTTGQLSGAGEVDLDELDEFYNNDGVYEEFLNEQEANSDANTSSGNNNETTEKPEGWHTGDDLDAYLDSIGGTNIIYGDSGPGSFYAENDW